MCRSEPFLQLSFGHTSETGNESLVSCGSLVIEIDALTSLLWLSSDWGMIRPEGSTTMVGREAGAAGLVGRDASSATGSEFSELAVGAAGSLFSSGVGDACLSLRFSWSLCT